MVGYKILEPSHGLVFDTINREEASDLEVAGKGALASDVKHFGTAHANPNNWLTLSWETGISWRRREQMGRDDAPLQRN